MTEARPKEMLMELLQNYIKLITFVNIVRKKIFSFSGTVYWFVRKTKLF